MSDKPYPASSQKRQKASQAGKTYKCQLVSDLIAALAMTVWLVLMAPTAWVRFSLLVSCGEICGFNEAFLRVREIGRLCIFFIIATLGVGAVATLACQLFFPRRALRLKGITVGFCNLSPKVYLKSLQTQFIFNILAIIIVSSLFTFLLFSAFDSEHNLILAVLVSFGTQLWPAIQSPVFLILSGVLSLALLDCCLRRRAFLRELRMSLQELRQEQRESEGDQLTRSHLQSEQRALIYQSVEKQLRNSQVLVVGRR